jgi:hypothetical protein
MLRVNDAGESRAKTRAEGRRPRRFTGRPPPLISFRALRGRRGVSQVEVRSAVSASASRWFVFVRLDRLVQADGLVGICIGILGRRGAFRIVDDVVLREHGFVVAFASRRAAVADVVALVDWRKEFLGFVGGKRDRDVPVIWNTRTCNPMSERIASRRGN